MTDLKPEDLGEASALLMDLARRFMLGEIIGQTPYAAKCAVAMEMVTKDLADRARMEKALRNLTRAFDSLQVERWDDETKVEIHLPRTKRVRPVSWVYVSDVKEARQALGASQ